MSTTIHVAAGSGDVEKVRELLASGRYDVNVVDGDGWTPLHHACAKGQLDMARILIAEFNADMSIQDNSGYTPLMLAIKHEHDNVAHSLLEDYQCPVDNRDKNGDILLHAACRANATQSMKTLIQKYDKNKYPRNNANDTPLHVVALHGKQEVALALIKEFDCDVHSKGFQGRSVLHSACNGGNVSLVRALVNKHKADINARDDINDTPLHVAALSGKQEVALALIKEFGCDVQSKGFEGKSVLHSACAGGNVGLVRALVEEHKADINARDDKNNTPLHVAALSGKQEVALALIKEFGCVVQSKGFKGRSVLHYACDGGNVGLVRALVEEHKADINARDDKNNTPLHVAAISGKQEVALALIKEFGCVVQSKGFYGRSVLHYACGGGNVSLVRALVNKHKADINARDDINDTPLHVAALSGKQEVALALIKEFGCDVQSKGFEGKSVLHSACAGGNVGLVRALVEEHKADINARDDKNNTPLHVAALSGKQEVALALIKEFGCVVQSKGFKGRSVLHSACNGGNVGLVRALVEEHKADINARDDKNNTPLHVAALSGKQEVALALIKEFGCDVQSKGFEGKSVLHSACAGGNVSLVRALVGEHKVDINAREDNKNTPLHVAAYSGKQEVALALIKEFCCDIKSKGYRGRSALHSACAGGHADMVKCLSKYISPLVIDNNGNTPLFTSSAFGHSECVEALLELNAPVLIRNNDGKTPKDVAKGGIKSLLERYTATNSTFLVHYDTIQKHAKNKYSGPEHITRIFVLGNPGAGKSSFIASLKREGFFESLWRVSESSVPPHTAGIVPSIHTSKHYGRVLFYDFAGDAEYYSSHAAILENLASTRNGDNIFFIVADLREDNHRISCLLNYWVSFIGYQCFENRKPYLVILGSHLDLVGARGEGVYKFEKIVRDVTETGDLRHSGCFMLDCCKPGSREINSVVQHIKMLVKDSPRYSLSPESSVLLGLLEKDFQHVTACPIQTIISHIEDTKVYLPTDVESLRKKLFELHELGLLFMIKGDKNDVHLILNISRLTHDVHQLLFSDKAIERLREKSGNASLFHVGIVSEGLLSEVLPAHITKQILIQLQYCQVIHHKDVGTFSSSDQCDSSVQSYLFFPALCSAEKSDTAWVTSPDLNYGIGWLARCTDPRDYFAPRFHHVLFLRLVFKFALSDSPTNQPLDASSDHKYFPHYCRMWKTGVYWISEDGIWCMVELINSSTEVVVLTKAKQSLTDQCVQVFNNIISCVMEAMAEFCHSIQPKMFFLDSTDESDYLSVDNLFELDKVEKALASSQGEGVVSVTRKRCMEQERLLFLHKFSLWHSLFPMDLVSVLKCLENVSRNLYTFGVFLGLPTGILDAIEKDYPNNTERQRTELVRRWLSSSLDPCWWHLAQALKQIKEGVLADKIERNEGESKFVAIYNIIYIYTKGLSDSNHKL